MNPKNSSTVILGKKPENLNILNYSFHLHWNLYCTKVEVDLNRYFLDIQVDTPIWWTGAGVPN